MNIFKLAYNDPRPFMTSPEVHAYECVLEYGNPSGHAMLNMLAYIIFPYLFDKNFYEFRDSITNKISLRKILILVFSLIWILMIGFTRVYLGVHSLNQVFLGFVYGILFFAFYLDMGNELLNKVLVNWIKLDKKQKQKALLQMTIVFIVSLVVVFIEFIAVKEVSNKVNNDIYKSVVVTKCKHMNTYSDFRVEFLFNKCFVDSGSLAAAYGVVVGILLSQGVYKGEQIFQFHYTETPLKKLLLRSCVQLFPCAVAYGILTLIYIFAFPDELYLKFFWLRGLALFIVSFVFTYATPLLFYRFKLEIKGDFLQFMTEKESVLLDYEERSGQGLSLKTSGGPDNDDKSINNESQKDSFDHQMQGNEKEAEKDHQQNQF